MKILDCTLRDGGYYNQWNFDYAKARDLIIDLNEAGVDIIEVGYKSNVINEFAGLFKYCNESLLSYLHDFNQSEYAFMIDIKQFIADSKIDISSLEKVILDQNKSLFSWVRIASHFSTIDVVPEFIQYFKSKGYQICFNLMGGSLLSEEQILNGIKKINNDSPDIFYIADSFGSFYPQDIKSLIQLIKNNFNGQVGIHTHDNQGMAFSNTLAAIEAGVDIVDGTLTGMGRGAGNLVLEQFMQKYADMTGNTRYKPNALLNTINNYIQPLKDQYQWGFNYVYMLSGLKNIHPTYCQKLGEGNRYSMTQISAILENIPQSNRSKYNDLVLQEAIKKVIEDGHTATNELILADYQFASYPSLMIVAKGASVKDHELALSQFCKQKKALVIDCNHTNYEINAHEKIIAVLNQVKLQHVMDDSVEGETSIVTGQKSIAEINYKAENVFHVDFKLGNFNVSNNTIAIPDYDVGLFAIGIAILHQAKEIFMVGFDGFADADKNIKMESYFDQIVDYCSKYNINIKSLTPTAYANIPQSNVYAQLQL